MENLLSTYHPIIEFYQGKRKTRQFNLSLEETWQLKKTVVKSKLFLDCLAISCEKSLKME